MNERYFICIDDEAIVLDALKEQIQNSFGSEIIVEVAESGDEALEILDELIDEGADIPIVIADFIMPGMTGDTLLEKVHGVRPETRSILLTGQASIEGIGNAINNGNLFRFIAKPWEKEDLMLTLREALKSYDQDGTISKQNEELIELNTNLEKKVEERTEQLRELNATKDKFFSIIAHDLKNPFNTLLGFTELLLENLSDYTIDKIEEFIGILHETSKHSYTLLENLLEWSRAQTGRIKMEPGIIDAYQIAEENISLLTNQSSKKSIKLVNGIQGETNVFADENMIKTVLRNLISNAIKYTNENGQITVSAQDSGDLVEISVQDTGVGIKPENLNKLFQIDKNISTRGTADEGGTGLGLILCKEFVNKSGGEIWVESELGKGSNFKFTLPKNK